MIIDIVLLLVAAIVGLMGLLLFPLQILFAWAGVESAFQAALVWLFHPLVYIAYWVDLRGLANMINGIMGFLLVFFTYKLIRMMISMKSGDMEHPHL